MCSTLKSAYNKVTFNEKLAIRKENLHTKYMPFTYNGVTLNEKPPIMKQNLHIFFFIKVELSDFKSLEIKMQYLLLMHSCCLGVKFHEWL